MLLRDTGDSTLILLKPDAITHDHGPAIRTRIRDTGLDIPVFYQTAMTPRMVERHYAETFAPDSQQVAHAPILKYLIEIFRVIIKQKTPSINLPERAHSAYAELLLIGALSDGVTRGYRPGRLTKIHATL